MKKLALATALSAAAIAGTAEAGGRGGPEFGIASYGGGVGILGAVGFPIRIPALADNGLNTYGEIEMGAGFTEEVAFGGDASLGLLFPIDQGLDLYGSLGAGLGSDRDPSFGLAGEVGINLQVNNRVIFVEGGAHPGNGYFSVGLMF